MIKTKLSPMKVILPNMTESRLEVILPPMTPMRTSHLLTLDHDDLPSPNYSKFSEKIRISTPSDLQCSMFCGGRKCKYECSNNWSNDDMAIPGIYSHWVTDNILAMARPNTENIEQHNFIEYFHKFGIKSIINLQEPGEHANCGNPLNSSGFSYDPNYFMNHNVYFYNFQWKDYSIVSEESLLDMVKVMTFALKEGKLAIHCHAGLGRTGVLIASYLVYTLRCKPQDAINYVRTKRPQSIQTRGQIVSVLKFAQYVIPLFVVFAHILPSHSGLTLAHYLRKQRLILHGYELRHLKYIPKIVYVICERLLHLCGRRNVYSRGLTRYSFVKSKENISFKLNDTESFWKNFFSSATSGYDIFLDERPSTNSTIQYSSSGIATPDTVLTNLSDSLSHNNNNNINDSNSSTYLRNNHDNIMLSLRPPSYHNLSPVTEYEDDENLSIYNDIDFINTPINQISLVGLDTPKKQVGLDTPKIEAVLDTPKIEVDLDTQEKQVSLDILKIQAGLDTTSLGTSILDTPNKENTSNNGSVEDLSKENTFSFLEKTLTDEMIQIDTLPERNNQRNTQGLTYYQDTNDFVSSQLENHFFNDKLPANDFYNNLDQDSIDPVCSSGFLSDSSPGTHNSSYDEFSQIIDRTRIFKALTVNYRLYGQNFISSMINYQRELNSAQSGWERLNKETDAQMLCALLWSWLENLKEPVLNRNALCYIVIKAEKPIDALIKLDQNLRYTVEYLIRFIARLQPDVETANNLILHLMAYLTKQCLKSSTGLIIPDYKDWPEMRKGTAGRVVMFAKGLYQLVQ